MAIKVETLNGFIATLVRAVYRIAITHRPVVGRHILVSRIVIFTVFAAERPLKTFATLMDLYIGTLNRFIAVKTLDFCKLASLQLLILRWVGIEVVFKSS